MKNGHLSHVRKPTRYVGGEWGAVPKKAHARLRFVLAYPDTYEIGMSYLGLQLLYSILNNRGDIGCERVFAPWPDREAQMRQRRESLRTLESNSPVASADIVGLSLQHELTYTNALLLLDLAGLPLHAGERNESHPLVIAGGPCAYNPAPMSAFVDAFVVGEAEEAILEVADSVIESKEHRHSRLETLRRLASLPGVFVPSLYGRVRNRLGESCFGEPLFDDVPERVTKRWVNFEQYPYPTNQIVPSARIAQRRLSMEIMRGCARGCRFCQAGFTNRPLRERPADHLLTDAAQSLEASGYDEISLLSLSSGDYSHIQELVKALMTYCAPRNVSVSLPSLRLDGFADEIPRTLERARAGGLTFAPEAGTERLRRAINKRIEDTTILQTIESAMSRHWASCKLYFMVGLPTETEQDVMGIPELSLRIRRNLSSRGWRRGTLHVSVGTFSPKPHTPFQWCGQIPVEEIQRRFRLIRSGIHRRGIKLSTHDIEPSVLEAALARGDVRLSSVLEAAFRAGCRFDEWSECFRWDYWREAFASSGLQPNPLAEKTYEREDLLPWSVIDSGLNPQYLWHEHLRAFDARPSRHCGHESCRACGVCDGGNIVTVRAPFGEPQWKLDQEPPGDQTFRYRLKYEKRGPSAWLSHQDLIGAIDSIFRRARIDLAFSQGYHPHPRIVFAGALPVGVESWGEYLDITATRFYEPEVLCRSLNASSPEGIVWVGACSLDVGEAKISGLITADEFRVSWNRNLDDRRPLSLDVRKRFGILFAVDEEDGVRIVLSRRQGKPPQIQNLLQSLQDVGAVPFGASVTRLEQFRDIEDNLAPVIAM